MFPSASSVFGLKSLKILIILKQATKWSDVESTDLIKKSINQEITEKVSSNLYDLEVLIDQKTDIKKKILKMRTCWVPLQSTPWNQPSQEENEKPDEANLELHNEQEFEKVRFDQNHLNLDNNPWVLHDKLNENDPEFKKETTSTSQQSRSSTWSNEGSNSNSIELI